MVRQFNSNLMLPWFQKDIWIIIDTLKNLIFFWIFSNWQPGTKSQQKHMTPLVDARVLYSWKNKSFMRISNPEHNVYIISSTTWIINAYILYPTHTNCSIQCSWQFSFLMISILINLYIYFARKEIFRRVSFFHKLSKYLWILFVFI